MFFTISGTLDFKSFLMLIYYFEEGGEAQGERERERERERIPSRLCADSTEPCMGPKAKNHEVMT